MKVYRIVVRQCTTFYLLS